MSTRPPRPANPRGALRRTLLLAGILPALVVLAFGLKVAFMLQGNADGREGFELGDYDGAVEEFAGTRRLNWLEPWVAPFDEGTAHHAEGQYDAAILAYETALEDVPAREECTVRINLALVHEAVGDTALESGARDQAIESWQRGVDVLAAGGCPADSGRGREQTEDAAEVDERLRAKIEENQQPQQQPEEQEDEQPQEEPPGEDPREEQLERNNQRGQDQRRQDQELYDDEDYTRPNAW